ncbi:cadmium-translocating P-type ATPase [Proteiniclasticum sp. SCR006]|uniref:Cadmium-translocating P-type ATPase n=1 Tax=Proteiniclasticum aestuarii TaxID=2817862 RepID=A0A939KIG8_9CLOT|nr:heavy metal translocating P-type ATPase [Proteiniclasticum aestuarii]MBO1264133.1 cadmium-translocating P-type ATPase [Proteiniclasticum aestuarii]
MIASVKNEERKTIFDGMKPHVELMAAGLSGGLILIGWYLLNQEVDTAAAVIFVSAFVIGGYAKAKQGIEDTLATKKLNVELLMILAAVGSALIGYWMEGAILIFIFGLSGALETYTMNKSHREISSLMDLQPEEATRIKGEEEEVVPVGSLSIGDLLLIRPGERIPADGKIVKGQTNIDESSISGESIPVQKSKGDEVFASTVNLRGIVTVEMIRSSDETLFHKIIELVQSAQSEKSPSQQFIERFEGPYVRTVLIVVGLMMFVPHYAFGWSWNETWYRAMVLLVVASPCALVASVTPATLSAISNGARNGILFKGGVHLENIGRIKVIAFDKTGTLTKGKPEVTDVYVRDGITKDYLLSHVAEIERYSNHPLAGAVVSYATEQLQETALCRVEGMEDIAGFGVRGTFSGVEWKVGKAEFVGKEEAEAFHGEIMKRLSDEGKTVIFARDGEGIAGLIALKDVVREEALEAIRTLQEEGIKTVMLTGDHERTAAAIARESGIDRYTAHCLPESKAEAIRKLQEEFGMVAMVGDGINDAPALATATVGISMGEGSDVALETADVVLMKNHLPLIAQTVKLSTRMNRIVKQNIFFSITVIMLLIASNFFQVVTLPLGVVFHEGSTILVILNGLRLLKN